ncbi:unnamed protein product [Phaedon cochleariae]|uniref:Peptidoglycan-recognition protein n=1 Tax=Phaedon cochleariae TaxID=80249 RepID=A0A9P0DNU1_PHACE|nr:unnamed protein product [Phaedon cochleariae]
MLGSIDNIIFLVSLSGFIHFTEASCPNIISRSSWGAVPAKSRQNLSQNPPPYVVVHHSETPACQTTEKCKQRIKNIQYDHMTNRNWQDIGYNFLIGGDGNIYEGRGWGTHGSHVPKYNRRSIGICLIGDFTRNPPPSVQLTALNDLISCASDTNNIRSDYHLIGHRQGRETDCPGDALFEEVKRMPHWEAHPN